MCDYACVLAESFKAVYAFQTFLGFLVFFFGESLTIKFTVNIIIKWNQILNESKFL